MKFVYTQKNGCFKERFENNKGAFVRHYKWIEDNLDAETNVFKLKTGLDALTVTFKKFESIQEKYESLLIEENVETNSDIHFDVEQTYFHYLAKLQEKIADLSNYQTKQVAYSSQIVVN